MSDSILNLTLKKRWFEMTKEMKKTEDYREITAYWCNRFLLYDGMQKPVKWWALIMNVEGCFFRKKLQSFIEKRIITFKHFDINKMTLGYPNASDTEKILMLKHNGISIRKGREEWGAKPNNWYFVVSHGGAQ